MSRFLIVLSVLLISVSFFGCSSGSEDASGSAYIATSCVSSEEVSLEVSFEFVNSCDYAVNVLFCHTSGDVNCHPYAGRSIPIPSSAIKGIVLGPMVVPIFVPARGRSSSIDLNGWDRVLHVACRPPKKPVSRTWSSVIVCD